MNAPFGQPGTLLDPANPINKGLVGWWPMWEGAGEGAMDISGGFSHGLLTNGAKFARGGIDFDGAGDFINIANPSTGLKTLKNGPFSISIRVMLDLNVVYGGLIFLNAIGITQSNGAIYGVVSPFGSVAVTAPITLGKIQHIVGMYDGTAYRIFLDGVESFGTTSDGGYGQDNQYRIMKGYADGVSDGVVYEAAAWNRGLTPTEINKLFRNRYSGLRAQDISRLYAPAAAAAGGGLRIIGDAGAMRIVAPGGLG